MNTRYLSSILARLLLVVTPLAAQDAGPPFPLTAAGGEAPAASEVEPASVSPTECQVAVSELDQVSLTQDGHVVMMYNARHLPSPKADAPWYGRSGFIDPVLTPSGRQVTAGFPRDHMHQHGLMFAWTSAVINGRPVDFWNSAKQEGHIEHLKTVRADEEMIVVRLRHFNDTTPTPTVVLNETWELSRVPHQSAHVFDLVSTQTCASEQPLTIGAYHYGGMCVRGPDAWLREATMLTSEGKHRQDGNHSRPHWVAMFGTVDGGVCGIAAMSHPDNFRAPQPVRLHPDKPYFCFAPMVLGEFQIKPAESYVSRYRFVAFDGQPDVDRLNELWQSYAAASSHSGRHGGH